jgi:hypothetical protein
MSKSVWILVLCALLIGAGEASAKTPDGKPPSQETVCDNETGAAYGLCNSYCEAKDCDDPRKRASDKGCESVRKNFEKKTGRPMPCLLSCSCPSIFPLFADVTSGAQRITQCFVTDELIWVVVESGDLALVDSRSPASCSVNGEPPFHQLTATEQLVCRVALRNAAAAQGITCGPPE